MPFATPGCNYFRHEISSLPLRSRKTPNQASIAVKVTCFGLSISATRITLRQVRNFNHWATAHESSQPEHYWICSRLSQQKFNYFIVTNPTSAATQSQRSRPREALTLRVEIASWLSDPIFLMRRMRKALLPIAVIVLHV